MKVLTNYNALVGKTISFAHMPQFSDLITLVTTEGEVLMAKYNYDWDDESTEIRVLFDQQVIYQIQQNEYLQKELGERGIFDLESHKKEVARKQQEAIEKAKLHKEAYERKLYEELKAKFENS